MAFKHVLVREVIGTPDQLTTVSSNGRRQHHKVCSFVTQLAASYWCGTFFPVPADSVLVHGRRNDNQLTFSSRPSHIFVQEMSYVRTCMYVRRKNVTYKIR